MSRPAAGRPAAARGSGQCARVSSVIRNAVRRGAQACAAFDQLPSSCRRWLTAASMPASFKPHSASICAGFACST
ncbi:DUF6525 family protein [Pseudomonas akapageensis]|uniref:DUF6525 family protein n=1 Tax=Pseudomonas akapageensis TaxID=2609961 RepID=UPI003CCCD91C